MSKQDYLQVFISCENTQQGMALAQALIAERLAFGGPVFSGPAKFLWQDKIADNDYSFLVTYTRADLKDELVRVAEATSAEMVCMISFIAFEANRALLAYLDAAFADRDKRPRPVPMAALAHTAFLDLDRIPGYTADSAGSLDELRY